MSHNSDTNQSAIQSLSILTIVGITLRDPQFMKALNIGNKLKKKDISYKYLYHFSTVFKRKLEK